MANLTKDQVRTIIENAPTGSDPNKIVQGLIDRGHTLEGLKQTEGQIPQVSTPKPLGIPSVLGNLEETAQDVTQTGQGVTKELGKAGQDIVDTAIGDLGLFEKAVQIGAQAFRGGSRAFGEVLKGVGKGFAPQKVEEGVKSEIQGVGKKLAEEPVIQDVLKRYQSLDPETKRNVDNALGYAEGLADILTAGTAKVATKTLQEITSTVARETGELGRSLFTKPLKSVDDLVEQADTAISQTAKAGEPRLSIKEKWVGISPDIKKRIAGKQDKLREYFDVAHARNMDDTAPTVNEYGAQQAQTAVDKMESLLNETGGKIGATRQKIGTYTASVDDLAKIENNFVKELQKLNLEIRNGVVRQKAGTVSKAGTGDVSVLNGLYQDLLAVKQSPKLNNLIDLRDAFSARVNFAKEAREASSEIDPLSRQVRADIAETAATIVGPKEASEVKKFSDFMEAYRDLRSYTDRKAGGEYLLRLVLSGRGGEARQIIQTIKEYTGIDLLDDATMMLIANDVVANSRQQNLFRQELTSAGLDVAALARGDARGAMQLLSDLAQKYLLDSEKTYLEAAK